MDQNVFYELFGRAMVDENFRELLLNPNTREDAIATALNVEFVSTQYAEFNDLFMAALDALQNLAGFFPLPGSLEIAT